MDTTRVLFSCSGVGILNRGIESFFREAFDGLKATPGLECRLLKGAGEPRPDETVAWCLPRTGALAQRLGRLTGRNGYVAEQWSTFLPVVREIRRHRPQVIFYSDSNLGFLLDRFRRLIGVPYQLLFSNGGPCHPPFSRTDYVQQVAPFYREEALQAEESPAKHFLVPYGINAGPAPVNDPQRKRELRAKLGLPMDRPILLSVGWISRQHKRMDYVIEEVARISGPRPYLKLLGAMDENSREIIEWGQRLLGPDHFSASSVPYEKVADYYQAVDGFVLASLQEGFGRVYLEALKHGLPVIAHRHPVIEYVVGPEGILGDLSRNGELARLLPGALGTTADPEAMQRRWRSVFDRFDWTVLASRYAEMFKIVAARESSLKQA